MFSPQTSDSLTFSVDESAFYAALRSSDEGTICTKRTTTKVYTYLRRNNLAKELETSR